MNRLLASNRLEISVLPDVRIVDENSQVIEGSLESGRIVVTDMAFKILEVYVNVQDSNNYEMEHCFLVEFKIIEAGRVTLKYRNKEVKRISFTLANPEEFIKTQYAQVSRFINLRSKDVRFVNELISQKEKREASVKEVKGMSGKKTATTLRSLKMESTRGKKRRNPSSFVAKIQKPSHLQKTLLKARKKPHQAKYLSPPLRKQRPEPSEVVLRDQRKFVTSPLTSPQAQQKQRNQPKDEEFEKELEEMFGDKELILNGRFLQNGQTVFGMTVRDKEEEGVTQKEPVSEAGFLKFESKGGIHNTLSLDDLFEQIDSTAASRSEELKEFSPLVQKEISHEPSSSQPPEVSIELSEEPSEVESEASEMKEIMLEFDELVFSEQQEEQNGVTTSFINPDCTYTSKKKKEYEFMQRQHAEITEKEFIILGGIRFLNDNIIMSYLYYVATDLIGEEMRNRIYICDSFLYHTLAQSQDDSALDKFYKARDFLKREPQLFEKDFWFFPICKNQHWSLVILCYPRKYFQTKEDVGEDDPVFIERPAFLVMDSMLGMNEKVYGSPYLEDAYNAEFKKIISFMQMEYAVRKLLGKINEDPQYIVDVISPFFNFQGQKYPVQEAECIFVDVPTQPNGYDCGIFLLHYAELFLRDPSYILKKTYLGKREETWFLQEMVRYKRKEIAKIFMEKAEGRDPRDDYEVYFAQLEEKYCYKIKEEPF